MEKEVYKAITIFDIVRPAALCSVVQWKGSVPRKDYPLMLVPKHGRITGTVGGGCMEYDVIEKAKEVLKTQTAVLESFDLTNDDAEAEGSICGGTTMVLIEPFTKYVQEFWHSIDYLNGTSGLLITTVDKTGEITPSRSWVDSDNLPSFYPPKFADKVKQVVHNNKTETYEDDSSFRLIQKIFPPQVLHIFGAGHVGKAVADIAHFIDLDTHVYDDRTEFLTLERFPNTKTTALNLSNDLDSQISLSTQDYVLVATRGHHHDLDIMRWLLKQNVRYISLISSQRKWDILSVALRKEGFSNTVLQSVHSPVGLDIEAETVPEIAVSIISEIIHHYRKGYRSSLSLSGEKT